jgi:hypothetical protein
MSNNGDRASGTTSDKGKIAAHVSRNCLYAGGLFGALSGVNQTSIPALSVVLSPFSMASLICATNRRRSG